MATVAHVPHQLLLQKKLRIYFGFWDVIRSGPVVFAIIKSKKLLRSQERKSEKDQAGRSFRYGNLEFSFPLGIN